MRRAAIICSAIALLTSCEEEQTFRTVRFITQTQNQLLYQVEVGIPPEPLLINADTTGPISIDFTGEVGDIVTYNIGTNNTFIHAELIVNGEMVLVSDLGGFLADKQVSVRYILK